MSLIVRWSQSRVRGLAAGRHDHYYTVILSFARSIYVCLEFFSRQAKIANQNLQLSALRPFPIPQRPGSAANDGSSIFRITGIAGLESMSFEMGDKAGREEAPFPLTEVDKWVLSQTDEEFKYHNWDELREILGA